MSRSWKQSSPPGQTQQVHGTSGQRTDHLGLFTTQGREQNMEPNRLHPPRRRDASTPPPPARGIAPIGSASRPATSRAGHLYYEPAQVPQQSSYAYPAAPPRTRQPFPATDESSYEPPYQAPNASGQDVGRYRHTYPEYQPEAPMPTFRELPPEDDGSHYHPPRGSRKAPSIRSQAPEPDGGRYVPRYIEDEGGIIPSLPQAIPVPHYHYRPASSPRGPVYEQVRDPNGRGFVWVAATADDYADERGQRYLTDQMSSLSVSYGSASTAMASAEYYDHPQAASNQNRSRSRHS